MLEPIVSCDVERIIRTLAGVANGLKLGADAALIRETAHRSGYSCETIQLVIGLCAIYWGRVEWEGLQFHYKNDLVVKADQGQSVHIQDLASWEPYLAVQEAISTIKTNWLGHFSRKYSTESAEIRRLLPCIGIPELDNPKITIVSMN